ncbi:hypothetical protein ACHHYP_09570 [Achlya hypogyna]|uniref:BZIP domain-containing protein n=1 Tax=Achlya hypogyna TaxID=1202772 RepID=A0A1V9YMX6_ACHHY|nr:hypothetical protein ACHHYP_09570 [Achlya hypogyna]
MDERRREHVRLRNRLKQQRHKARYINERDLLQDQVAQLTALLATWRPHPRLATLPWRDVAAGLADAVDEAQTTRAALQRRYAVLQDLMRGALLVGASISRHNNVPTSAMDFAWECMTLATDPTARRLGLDWYTKHMYHNTDMMLERSRFPSDGAVSDVIVDECGNDCVDVFGRVQVNHNVSFEEAYAILAPRINTLLRGDSMAHTSAFLDQQITSEIDPTLVYRRMAVSGDDSRYYVSREFATEGRVVFLLGNLAHDELQPANQTWRPRRFWYVLERHGTGCRVRFMWYNGPYVVDGQLVPWASHVALTENEYGERINAKSPAQFQSYLAAKYGQDDVEMLSID